MAIDVAVKHRDGTRTETRVWASTEVAFEDYFSTSWSQAFTEEHPRQKYLYFVAWHSLSEAGKTGLEFAEWMKTVDTVELAGGESVPLDPAPPLGSSES